MCKSIKEKKNLRIVIITVGRMPATQIDTELHSFLAMRCLSHAAIWRVFFSFSEDFSFPPLFPQALFCQALWQADKDSHFSPDSQKLSYETHINAGFLTKLDFLV